MSYLRRSLACLVLSALAFACSCQSGRASPAPTDAVKADGTATKRAAGDSLWESAEEGRAVQIEGRLRRVGNEPFSSLVLSDDQGHDWYLDDAAQKLLRGFEQKRVKLSGIVHLKTPILANGKKLATLRELTKVRRID